MGIVLEEIVGPVNMRANRKADAIAILQRVQVALSTRQGLLGRWGRTVGVTLTAEDFAQLVRPGEGRPAPPGRP